VLTTLLTSSHGGLGSPCGYRMFGRGRTARGIRLIAGPGAFPWGRRGQGSPFANWVEGLGGIDGGEHGQAFAKSGGGRWGAPVRAWAHGTRYSADRGTGSGSVYGVIPMVNGETCMQLCSFVFRVQM
jgi:hypothetical protein